MTGYYWLLCIPEDEKPAIKRTLHATGDEALALALKYVRRSGRKRFKKYGATCPALIYKVTVEGRTASNIAYEAAMYEAVRRSLAYPKASREIDRKLQNQADASWLHYLRYPKKKAPPPEDE